MGMEVWDESNERRSEAPRRSRIRRFMDRPDAPFLLPAAGAFIVMLFSSLGFKVSGANQAIAELHSADTAQVRSIDSVKANVAAVILRTDRIDARLDRIDGRLDFIVYLSCLQARKHDPSPVLERSCERALAHQDPQ
jgi:hypothetical protein